MSLVPPWSEIEAYLAPYRQDLRRKEQFRWAQVYVAGLLADIPRKTVEGIARHIPPPGEAAIEDRRQALQNFLQESPWDEQPLLRRYRQEVERQFRGAGVLVIEDLALVKQGRHSVGVHRQLCAQTGKKMNCQLIPSVFLRHRNDCVPLAMRLYLPRSWQTDAARLDRSKVPPECRAPASRLEVALGLLEVLRAEAVPYRPVVLGHGYHLTTEAEEAIVRLGFEVAPVCDDRASVAECIRVLREQTGLNHFEGRTWRGLHHHLSLVILAHGFHAEMRRARAQGRRTKKRSAGNNEPRLKPPCTVVSAAEDAVLRALSRRSAARSACSR